MPRITEDDVGPDEVEVLDYLSDAPSEEYDIPKPHMNEDFPSTLCFLGAPITTAEKIPKLSEMFKKVAHKSLGDDNHECKISIDWAKDKEGGTTGVGFMNFPSPGAAKHALGYFGNEDIVIAKRQIRFFPLNGIHDILQTPEKFTAPEQSSTDETFYRRAGERDWLLDQKGREQILIRCQDDTEIYWNDPDERGPVLQYGGEREKAKKKVWCDNKVQWSKNGSFLCTFHRQGIVQWTGPEFEKKNRFACPNVKYIDFSPDEKYLMSWNGTQDGGDPEAYMIFDVRTGEKVKTFKTPEMLPHGGSTEAEFPHYLWSPDGTMFARMSAKNLFVYAVDNDFKLLPVAGKLDKFYGRQKLDKGEEKPKGEPLQFKDQGIAAFSWSPKDNVVAIWQEPKDDGPGRLVITELPSRKQLQTKTQFQVRDATMYWQSEGDYLALMVTRMSKSGKSGKCALEIFNMRKRSIPVDSLNVDGEVKHFAWEPRGNRFAMLTQDENGRDNKVQFYRMGKDGIEKMFDYKLAATCFNHISWAPYGTHFVLSAMGSGEVQFCTLNDTHVTVFHRDEHFMLNEVHWDPSSRFVITAVTCPIAGGGAFRYNSETGYTIWSFQGRKLYTCSKERLYQVCFRPHAPTLLDKEKLEDIHKNLKAYSKKYDQIDEAQKEAQRKILLEERQACVNALQSILDRVEGWKATLWKSVKFDSAWEQWKSQESWEDSVEVIETELEKTEELIS